MRTHPERQLAESKVASSPIAGVTIEQVAFDAPWTWLAAAGATCGRCRASA